VILRRAQYELAGRVGGPFLASLDGWKRTLRARGRTPRETPFGPPLQSLRKLKEIMTAHYFQARYADGAVPVAWVTSGFPVEVLRPFGFHAVYPENHAAMCGVQRLVPGLSDAVEALGYSRDLCSYARTDLGSVVTGQTPVGRLPRPDLLACCTNICQTVLYWYRALADHFQVPQLEELVRVAERISGRRADPEALAAVARKAKEGTDLWADCLATGKSRPAPWTGIDGFFHMAPIVALRGTDTCNAYYRMLRDELRDRAQRGIGGLREERHRLLWDNLPIWFAVREVATLLATRGFNFVCTSYTNAWAEAGSRIDPEDLIGSAADSYTHIILNQDLPNRLGILRRLSREYGVDGAVLHSDRSCKPYSIGQVDLKERLAAETGIRVLLLEADHSDPRAWSREQADNRLTAFMESFE
jgi:benzoyl-CoA reductase/2-hydroxyglutaryl-CoA dehydratase subunit BcrC/BadD/HgdB